MKSINIIIDDAPHIENKLSSMNPLFSPLTYTSYVSQVEPKKVKDALKDEC